jgi:aryl-alcohol dehydrogenase-like predicted oxidoreductase
MKYRTLGRTGLEVAEVGIGTWQLADDPECWVGADLDESYRSLVRYVELGGNFIDTAWMYGWDDSKPERHPSQELIGRFLQDTHVRDKVYIASKVAPKNFKWPAQSGIPIDDVFPNEWIRKSVDDCLHSLRVEYIDLMQFHVWHDEFADRDEWKEEIQRLTREGKVKHWGISINNYEPENVLKTLDTGLIDAVQLIFNIFHQKPIEHLLPYAKENNIGLIARVPLDEGGLTGKFTMKTEFPEGDLRRRYFASNRLPELIRRTDSLKGLLGDEAQSLIELALRWILSFDEISTVIPGMRKVTYVEQNTAVSDGRKLSEELMYMLKEHSWERDFYLAD